MKILIVDDHAIVRAGLRRLLAAIPGLDCEEAVEGREGLAKAREFRPDLVMMDLNMPGLGGIALLQRFLADMPKLRVLVLSMHSEPIYAVRALEAGAAGYASKNVEPAELLQAVQKIAGGGRYVEASLAQEIALGQTAGTSVLDTLTERDLEILRLLACGRSLREVASSLAVSYKTVANTCSAIKAKLGVTRTADLIRLAMQFGLTG
jgi:DNA-binding NarL/FixJ family response regulator